MEDDDTGELYERNIALQAQSTNMAPGKRSDFNHSYTGNPAEQASMLADFSKPVSAINRNVMGVDVALEVAPHPTLAVLHDDEAPNKASGNISAIVEEDVNLLELYERDSSYEVYCIDLGSEATHRPQKHYIVEHAQSDGVSLEAYDGPEIEHLDDEEICPDIIIEHEDESEISVSSYD